MEKKREKLKREVHASYRELLKRTEWQEFAARFIERRGGQCEMCDHGEEKVEVHHRGYLEGKLPWEYQDHELMVLCRTCHENIHHWADQLWNEVLKADNQWLIYECYKAVKAVLERNKKESNTVDFNLR